MTFSSDWADTVLAHAPLAVAILEGPEHRVVEANRRCKDLLGFDDLVGRPLTQALGTAPGARLEPLIADAHREHGPRRLNELSVPLHRPSGSLEGWLNLIAVPLAPAASGAARCALLIDDATDKVRSHRALGRVFEERKQMAAEVKRLEHGKQELLSILGHELRNSMAPILSALELMRLKGDRDVAAEREIILRQAQHVVQLLDDLQGANSGEVRRAAQRFEPADLTQLVQRAAQMAEPLMQRFRHTLVLSLAPEVLPCRADKDRLGQVLAQLLSNAASFTPQGGTIELSTAREAGSVVVRVKDDGLGISEEALAKVFELFFQGPRPAGALESGMGVGLTMARNVVEMHGGSLVASSGGPGKGSTFTIRLPQLVDAKAEAPSPVAPSPPSRTRILVVDDNEDGAQLIAELLRVDGHEVEVCTRPLQALELAPRFLPQVALLDIALPGMDGYELATALRERLGPHVCRMVAFTGFGKEQDRQRSVEKGFVEHLVKPVDFKALRDCIARAVPTPTEAATAQPA